VLVAAAEIAAKWRARPAVGDFQKRRSVSAQTAGAVLALHSGKLGAGLDAASMGPLAKSEGGKKATLRAIVAVARKLSVLLHRLWVSGEFYKLFPKMA
jgi:hypothetical protein